MTAKTIVMMGAAYGSHHAPTIGATWATGTLPFAGSAIVYANNIFVVMPVSGSTYATSSDGVNWVSRSMPSSQQWTNLAYGNGIFVATSANNSVSAASSDGINWTTGTTPSPVSLITFGNGLFLTANSIGTSATSANGITWTSKTMPFTGFGNLGFGAGLYLAGQIGSTNMFSSPDGNTWTARTMPSSGNWVVTTSAGSSPLIAVEGSSLNAATSTDGITWTTHTMAGISQNWKGIFQSTSTNLTVTTAAPSAFVETTTDGITWTAYSLPTSSNWASCAYGDGTFVITNGTTSTAFSLT